ncbi:DUF445 domain-containing protein [Hydrogenothermus marinus]|uniref:Uncharacterized protein DUF445 n=1 Tax=Hydrogenothermus marinus TaxID=133270 RepID=A0A3M0BK41_9AQUI|nr:DUF445 family protein [Hydrogenothermus marinus]RMA97571.1 uncharacterized protein DUF445 [Hydrogenothermus marinus]
MEIKILLIPIVGAFIGYITNWLAIKMLFRPYNEVKFFGYTLPFTPGLIPKEREKIAENIAQTVAEHLLPEEKIIQMLEQIGYKEKVKKRVEIVINQIIDEIAEDIKKGIKEGISLGKISIKGFFVASALEKAIDKLIPIIKEKIKKDLYKKSSDKIIENIEEEIPYIISQLDIKGIIKDTLMNINIETLEKIIIGISENQLKYITYLGAVIGFLIGLFQVLIFLI